MTFDGFRGYKKAVAFMAECRAAGFSCGETEGGINVFDHSITPDKVDALMAIAEKHKAIHCPDGVTFSQAFREAMRKHNLEKWRKTLAE